MGGDYTRMTFDPRHDHSGVLMQQGRVQLDADWNELVDIFDRRFRVETVDMIGRSGVPRNAPGGFRIQGSGSGLTIGRGRMYVDGLLAENHGAGQAGFEPIWGEPIGADPLPYSQQPYLFAPYLPNPPTGAGPHVAYLDVWQRELATGEVIDKAIGIDTATRLQTVWQVRFLENVGAGVTCANVKDEPKWITETAPSSARLTTEAIGVPDPGDPCTLSPTGGYRGLENRLYRIEIHDDGTVAGKPATFKWSRDNGSVTARILSMTGAPGPVTIEVDRIGRDPILRFQPNDWVELTDDARELAGQPGVMARIQRVEAATNLITFSSIGTGTIDTNRTPRVRRWDQRSGVNADGVVPIGAAGTNHSIEDGIRVRFTFDSTGRPHVGDSWVFAARTADASIEILNAAPPRAIRHHFAPLAVLKGTASPEDCRPLFPAEPGVSCDCTECVTPESHRTGTLTIQMAIDRVKARGGGKICLQVGIYRLDRPLRIEGARALQLVGKGHRTVLVHNKPGAAVVIDRSYEVTIERLSVASAASGLGGVLGASIGKARPATRARPSIAIAISNTLFPRIERCLLAQNAPFFIRRRAGSAAGGKGESRASRRRHSGVGIALAGTLVGAVIRDNVIFADAGIGILATGKTLAEVPTATKVLNAKGALVGEEKSIGGVRLATEDDEAAVEVVHSEVTRDEPRPSRYLATFELRIEDNAMACDLAGIDLMRLAGRLTTSALILHLGDTRIRGNSIHGCDEVGILLTGFVPGAALVGRRVEARPSKSSTSDERSLRAAALVGGVGAAGGLLAAGSRVDIDANRLAVAGFGIVAGSDEVRIAGNDIGCNPDPDPEMEFQGDGIYLMRGRLARQLHHTQVVGNRIQGPGRHGIGIDALLASALIKQNQIQSPHLGGIVMMEGAAGELAIEDNQLLDVAPDLERDDEIPVGIRVLRGRRVSVLANQIAGIGAQARASRIRAGIHASGCSSLRVLGNEVREVGPADDFAGATVGILAEAPFERLDVADNTVRAPDFGEAGPGTGHWYPLAILGGLDAESVFPTGLALGDARTVEAADADVAIARASVTGSSATASLTGAGFALPVTSVAIGFFSTERFDRVVFGDANLAVRGNVLDGAAQLAPVIVATPGNLVFAENRCTLPPGYGTFFVALLMVDGSAIVSNNFLNGLQAWHGAAVQSGVGPGGTAQATIAGNVSSGALFLNGNPLAPPWDALNIGG